MQTLPVAKKFVTEYLFTSAVCVIFAALLSNTYSGKGYLDVQCGEETIVDGGLDIAYFIGVADDDYFIEFGF